MHHTGSKKVKIVAHSMGGLVSRYYIKNYGGWKYVDKIITIGTPNHGVNGNIENFCGVTSTISGSNRPECKDMVSGGQFITSLNSGDETYMGGKSRNEGVVYATIAAKLNEDNKPEIADPCGDGSTNHDEVVCFDSVKLAGANNYNVWANRVTGSETTHSLLIDPSYVHEAYTFTKDFIID